MVHDLSCAFGPNMIYSALFHFSFCDFVQQIHTLVMSLHYTGIEIKTLHSLESWNGGVLVMVSGSVHVKGINRSRKFVQTFFLAPQEKGYFVLNDIFHYVDEEQVLQHPVPYLGQISLDSKLNVSTAIQEQGMSSIFKLFFLRYV